MIILYSATVQAYNDKATRFLAVRIQSYLRPEVAYNYKESTVVTIWPRP